HASTEIFSLSLHDALPISPGFSCGWITFLMIGKMRKQNGNKKGIYLVGAGGHAKVVSEIVEYAGHSIKGVFDQNPDIKELLHFRSEEHTSELQSRENLVCR